MTSESEAEYLDRAEREINQVDDEPALVRWHDEHMSSHEYLHMSQNGCDVLEHLYQRKAYWLTGAGA